MKKFIMSLLIILFLIFGLKDKIIIPDNAIRLRIIASSNDDYDQEIKLKVKDKVEDEMYKILDNTYSIALAKNRIENNLLNIDNVVKNTLKENNYNKSYKINFGKNYFPEKTYKGITYEEGMYESLVVTLGNGKGDNWWCVLFPPFCLIEAEDSDEVEYRFKIKEILDKYF